MATKTELIREIRHKARNASPMVKRLTFSGLQHQKKSELERIASKMRVTRGGDINLS
jgi:hypothetical protein